MRSHWRRDGRPSHLRRTLGWSISGVATILLAELVLRISGLAPTGGLATVTQAEFDRVPGLFSPGQRLVDRVVPSLPYPVTIDSLGYRGTPDFPRTKPQGEVRVLMLGDSFTFGYLVPDDSTLPALVQAALQSRCTDPIRVINAGVGGTTIVAASRLAQRALPLGIDLAILTFTENDVGDLAQPIWYQLEANRTAKSRFPLSLVYPVARQTALWNLLLKVRATWAARHAPRIAPQSGGESRSDSLTAALRAGYADSLSALRDTLRRHGTPLLFVAFPSHLTVYGKASGEQVTWVTSLARDLGIPTSDLTASLRADGRGEEALYLLPVDGHPSVAGYALTAPVIAARAAELLGAAVGCRIS